MARQPAPAAATSGAALPPGGPLFGGSGAAPAAPAPSSLGMARSMVYEQPRYPAYQTTGPIGNGS
jgi:hypothetical protein